MSTHKAIVLAGTVAFLCTGCFGSEYRREGRTRDADRVASLDCLGLAAIAYGAVVYFEKGKEEGRLKIKAWGRRPTPISVKLRDFTNRKLRNKDAWLHVQDTLAHRN